MRLGSGHQQGPQLGGPTAASVAAVVSAEAVSAVVSVPLVVAMSLWCHRQCLVLAWVPSVLYPESWAVIYGAPTAPCPNPGSARLPVLRTAQPPVLQGSSKSSIGLPQAPDAISSVSM